MDIALKKKRLYGPDVHVIHREDRALAEKTYRRRPWLVRMAGRLLVRWETYIYSKLRDIPGIPELLTSPDPYTITTVFMGGHNLKKRLKIPDEAYFKRLEALIKAIHDRGVIHLDMRNRRNYGMDDNGNPYIVDFASSVYLPLGGALKRMLCAIDWMGYLKVKAYLNPDLLSDTESKKTEMGNTLSLLWFFPRLLRFFRHLFQRILR
jgi:RIO-like serine/threonine protein kinase